MHAFRGHMAHQHALDRQIFDYDLVIVSNQFSRKLLDQVVLDIASLPIACLKLGSRLQVVLAIVGRFSILDSFSGKLSLIVLDLLVNLVKTLRQDVYPTFRVIEVANVDVNGCCLACLSWLLNVFNLERNGCVIIARFCELADYAEVIRKHRLI